MKILFSMLIAFIFFGCSKSPDIIFRDLPKTHLMQTDFSSLPDWENENHDVALDFFINSCRTKRTKKIYSELCEKAKTTQDAQMFFESEFRPYTIYNEQDGSRELLTGYYEAELKGSLEKSDKYKYPLYKTPSDLVIVDLSSIYPDLKNYRLRGRIEGNKLVPYYSRDQLSHNVNSEIICYVDSKIDLFFLEIQGSGRVTLENGKSIFIGYSNQNGHKYSAIGRYLVKIGALEMEEVSLQSIRAWLEDNPLRVDEVLNYNKSVVYFKQRDKSASGSLGLELSAKRSIAVDRRYIPLGTMLFMSASIDNKEFNRIVSAQDTGGAIKGAVRADLFLGYGDYAMNTAGRLKSQLKLWMLLPKDKEIIND